MLITGGFGFIGSNLVHRLSALGDVKIMVLDALIPNQGGNRFNLVGIGDNVKIHRADIGDEYVVNHLVQGVDYIFNLAAQASHIVSFDNPHRDLALNCGAQLTLLEACRNFNPRVKIVFTSTRQVYGCPVYLPVDEQHRVSPVDINGVHKLAAEHYHLLYQRTFGIRSVCLRLTNTYGPRQLLSHNKQGFFGWFLLQALTGGVIELYGQGQQQRDLNYVDDVIEALLLAGASDNAEGEIFNLGGDEPVTLAEVACELISLTGSGSTIDVPFPATQQLIDIGNCWLSSRKIETALGWKPRTPRRVGLQRTIEYYQKHLAHYLGTNRSLFSPIEITRKA